MATLRKFQLELKNRFDLLETTDEVEQKYGDLVKVIREVGGKYCRKDGRSSTSKISSETLDLMRQRRENSAAVVDRHTLNKLIKKRIRSDLRDASTRKIKEAIERNKGTKVFAKSLGRSHLTKLRTSDGRTVTSIPEVLAEIENFYGQLYSSHAPKPVPHQITNDKRARLARHYTDDLPDIDVGEIRIALEQLRNNKAPGDDGITAELLKAGGTPILNDTSTL